LKVAQVCPRYYPEIGGVETHVQEISERLVKNGFEVEVICTDPTLRMPKHEIINGVKVTRFWSIAPADAYYFAPQIYYYLKNGDFDLVHAHSYHALPALFAALAKKRDRLVFTPHYHRRGHTFIRNLLHKPYKILGSKIFEKADKVICVSEYEKSMVVQDFCVPMEKIIKIPNGLNLDEFKDLRRKKERNIGKTLLYVGRLEEYKGIQHIIRLLPHLRNTRLEIIGKGPYENELHNLARELSVSDFIEWHINLARDELLQHYASSDVFFMLSTMEAYGITVAEALLAGTPCIVAKGSALDEFVDGERCIGIEKPFTSDKLLKAIVQLESCSFEKEMKNPQVLDWNDVTEKLIEVYRDKP